MSKLKEFYEKDKPRFWVIVAISAVVISTIAVGFIAGSETEEEEKSKEIVQVEVPVDTTDLHSNRGTEGEFFSDFSIDSTNNLYEDPKGNEVSYQEKKVPVQTVYATTKNSYRYYPPVQKQPVQTEVVKEVKPAGSVKKRTPSDGFTASSSSATQGSCKLVIDNRNRTVKTGSTVYMHASSDFTLSGIKVPKNTMIQGVATFQGERLKININQVKVGNTTHQVKWRVLDSGAEGIYCPERIGDDIAKQSSSDAIEKNKVEANLPVVGGIKLTLKKKNNESSVVIPDGYKLTVDE